MRDNTQKIIRGIELDSRQHDIEIDYIEDLEYRMKRYVSDSELLRIVEALDSRKVEVTEDGHRILYPFQKVLCKPRLSLNEKVYPRLSEERFRPSPCRILTAGNRPVKQKYYRKIF